MCNAIIDGDREIETVGELKSWLAERSSAPTVVYEPWIKDASPDDDCLCCVDISETLRRNNILYDWDGVWYKVEHVERKDAP
jgi:hypothetical protein